MEEYDVKYLSLRILKSIQEYLKQDDPSITAVYPIRVPEELLYQVLKLQGTENTDNIIHRIFRLGLSRWAEKLYQEVFSTPQELEGFVEKVKQRKREEEAVEHLSSFC